MIKLWKIIVMTFLFSTAVYAQSNSAEQQITATTQAWATAINQHDLAAIDALYDADGILYATYKNKLDTPAEINDYFKGLFAKKDFQVKFLTQNITVTDNMAVNSGKYVFSYVDSENQVVSVDARYNFVYLLTQNGWKIINHHSSVLPEEK